MSFNDLSSVFRIAHFNPDSAIIDNIYILDVPDIAWEDTELNKLHSGLRKVFDLSARFRELDYKLQSVIDNLQLITDLMNNREGHLLEWIVIILIFYLD